MDTEFSSLSQEWNGLLEQSLELKGQRGHDYGFGSCSEYWAFGNQVDLISNPLLASISFVTLVKFLSSSFLICGMGTIKTWATYICCK